MDYLNSTFKIKSSVDVYLIDSEEQLKNEVFIQFYKINTRKKLKIKASSDVAFIIAELDGERSLNSILKKRKINVEPSEVESLINFLLIKDIIEFSSPEGIASRQMDRFSRQINYLDELLPSVTGIELQEKINKQRIVIIGVGAVGSTAAIHLARAGVSDFILVDYKSINNASLQRHFYANKENIGQHKCEALKNYLLQINKNCKIEIIDKKIKPKTKLSKIIPSSSTLVIHSADEPYIGHITIKLGRFLWHKEIPLFVLGGFDAHLMSSGELIKKGVTPCADCCSNTFSKALQNWKPTYLENSKLELLEKKVDTNKSTDISSSGGTASMSLFSVSLAMIKIFYAILNIPYPHFNKRKEFLVNQGSFTSFEMSSQDDCYFCNER